ncbi:MAG: iron-containing redox enzyme family protein [Candidatus Thermoplasmatota archaeon]|jgi:pyrroloquinoline-quinone synthase|nr:iron-containing redox enzyme family protein [Candidatus Thermoplasmatota archaeon]MCL5790031.1 iron-containing redox enzyme family protein [Candidatus Thermoplasmatota archaeon]
MNICPACGRELKDSNISSLSDHFYSLALSSDPAHVMWLNRNISKKKMSEEGLKSEFLKFYDFTEGGLANWIRKRFVEKFFGEKPNPFVKEMQRPSKYTIMGYVTEHYHFLRQWVKSCAYIIARTDFADIQKYEFDNIAEEYFGIGNQTPHIELLLQMGESVGLRREVVLGSKPLKKTESALKYWDEVCSKKHWLDAMVSMHSLELIADKNVKSYGARYSYFMPEILDGGVTKETAHFLKAGYDADQYHSGEALAMVERYAKTLGMEMEVQSYFLRSADYFYGYLESRQERGKMYEKEL